MQRHPFIKAIAPSEEFVALLIGLIAIWMHNPERNMRHFDFFTFERPHFTPDDGTGVPVVRGVVTVYQVSYCQ